MRKEKTFMFFSSTLNTLQHHFTSDARRVSFLHIKLAVLQFNSILILSPWRWCHVPQIEGSVPQDRPSVPTPFSRRHSQVQVVTCVSDPLEVVGSHRLLPGFHQCARTAPRTQGNVPLSRSPACCNRT